jgi:type 2 lantibiotic biosynthesis protein LanM
MWQRALTIEERARAGDPTEVDHDLARRRYDRWKQLPAFRAPGATERTALAPLGVDVDQLLALLGETDDSLTGRLVEEPDWYADLRRWWADGCNAVQAGVEAPDVELLNVVVPAVLGAREEVAQRVHDLPLPETIRADVVHALADAPPVSELSLAAMPAMVLELHVARELGELPGDTGQERYRAFVEGLRDPSRAWSVLARYPVLARAVAERLGFWRDRSLELADRLARDLPTISAELWAGAQPTRLSLQVGQGDSHRGGRSVAVVTTDVGKVVYKPRCPAMDLAYDRVVRWYGASRSAAALPAVKAIDRTSYGWFEYIEEAAEPVPETVFKLGELNGLLHFLRATDMHYENVRISPSGPVATDLESLLHTERRYASKREAEFPNIVIDVMEESAIQVGIAPHRMVSGRLGDVVAADISVFGRGADQESLVSVPLVRSHGTDEIRIESGRSAGAPDGHQGRPVRPPLDDEEFVGGFLEVFDRVAEATDDWIRPGGLVDRFRGARSRFIPRPTMVYGKVLAESFHPDFLRDGLDRTMCLGKLLAGYWGMPHREPMIACEISDLVHGDIPFFEMDVETGLVHHDSRSEPISLGAGSPVETTKEFIATRTTPERRDLERRVLELSFAGARIAEGDHRSGGAVRSGLTRAHRRRPTRDPEDQRLVTALAITDELRRTAIRSGADLGWLSMTAATEKDWLLTPASIDLYSGLSGIALALLGVADATGDDETEDLAQACLYQLMRYENLFALDDEAVARSQDAFNTGAYGHVAGTAVALAVGGRRLGDQAMRDAARRLLQLTDRLSDADREHDLISGNAGAILAVLAVGAVDHGVGPERYVRRWADQLVRSARSEGEVLHWPQADDGISLVGFSHGTTGIALALARAAGVLDDPGLLEHARRAIAYDRRGMVASSGDWVDRRVDRAPSSAAEPRAAGHMRAWCHGSPGAGLGRAELLAVGGLGPDDDLLTSEVALAIGSTMESIAGSGTGNMSICHGDVGNLLALEAMLAATRPVPDVRSQTEPLWDQVCRRGEERGWPCGVPGGTHVPGLMMGLSGTAWGLAHSVAPQGLHLLTLRDPGLATAPELVAAGLAESSGS